MKIARQHTQHHRQHRQHRHDQHYQHHLHRSRILLDAAWGLTFVALLALLFYDNSSFAQSTRGMSSASRGMSMFLGASLAHSSANLHQNGITPLGGSERRSDNGIKIFGGMRLSQELSLEAQYNDAGEWRATDSATGNTLQARIRSLGVAAVLAMPLTSDFELTGKAGLAYSKVNNSTVAAGTGITTPSSANGLKPYLGAGVQFRLSPGLKMRSEYEWFALRNKSRSNVFSVGLAYEF